MPRIRIATGCHPHNAKHYDDALEAALRERLADPRVCAVGEIGLDYHYDFSPRDDQRQAFRRQVRLAKECGLPVVLHVREAHAEAFSLMQEEGFPEAGTLLHCFNLDWATLEPWVEAGCHVAFGGPLTFKKADEVREAASKVGGPSSNASTMVHTNDTRCAAQRANASAGSGSSCRCAWVSATGASNRGASTMRYSPFLRFWRNSVS